LEDIRAELEGAKPRPSSQQALRIGMQWAFEDNVSYADLRDLTELSAMRCERALKRCPVLFGAKQREGDAKRPGETKPKADARR
jgi:hypothetical protein